MSRKHNYDKTIKEVICPYCKNSAHLTDSSVIYGRSYGMIWLCRPCDAYVGTHSNSERHAPLGTLANKELRYLRGRAHACFDALWKSGKMLRNEAYAWLSKRMEIPVKDCHIAMFNEIQCKKVLQIIQGSKHYESNSRESTVQ